MRCAGHDLIGLSEEIQSPVEVTGDRVTAGQRVQGQHLRLVVLRFAGPVVLMLHVKWESVLR